LTDYLKVVLSQTDIERQDYKSHLGGGSDGWQLRGAFQLELLKYLGLGEQSTLLDVGCGPGRAMTHFVGFLLPGRYTGVDYNESFIKVAEMAVVEEGLAAKNPTLKVLGSFDFSSLHSTFDFVIVFSVLNHCSAADRQLFFRNLSAVMNPQTRVFVTHAKWFRPHYLADSGLVCRGGVDFSGLDIRNFGWNAGETISPILEFTRLEGV
jgi:2-polyprenyl-3-methyl-5-hydroxy-6-metoxy-1,4-benzoquinol methylase